MDWDQSYYVRLYRSQSPDWLALPVLTRGLFAELLLLADRAGRIPLGKSGLRSVAVPLRDRWEDIESHVQRLLDDGCLVLDGGALSIPNFVLAQARAKTSTERSRDLRDRRSNDAQPTATPTRRGQRSATPSKQATQGDDMQRDATVGDEEQRAATPGDACNDKEQTEQTDQISPPTPSGGERERGGVPVDGEDGPTESELFQAYTRGTNVGTGTLMAHSREDKNALALTTLWGLLGQAKGTARPAFLAQLEQNVAAYVREAVERGQPQQFEANYAPYRFLAWVQAHEAGIDPWPKAPKGPSKGPIAYRQPLHKATGQAAPRGGEPRPPSAAIALASKIGGPR